MSSLNHDESDNRGTIPSSMKWVWVTRPRLQGEQTAQRLIEMGYQPWVQPVMDIVPIDLTPSSRQALMNLDEYQKVIFVSQNAVRFGCLAIEDFWPQWPVGVAFFGIGEATVLALESQGIQAQSNIDSAAKNSEALLALPALQSLEHNRVLILRGKGGRETLKETLEARGAKVEYCELYERRLSPEAENALRASVFSQSVPASSAILAYSGDSLAYIDRVIASAGLSFLKQLPIIVPGERVAKLAQEREFYDIRMADNASDKSMLKMLP
ncbi:uroporphyrinogen-III synthase [Marinibactrum halimedae]|uniref:Uroporphyrinogen-III synthase n=1 Tax=Marinibactrum halimedae TaxID=1444977 RepID=A0AA37TD91_9GAMM|nr:uroporphyrinogen-III synthase [Marinibactrum halimedae]MCD9458301.1 uroporphyrinogen-III synthase [Marinibactrum halimedae]GLS27072.1 uroporphyrinogen-III synthase [Marinibactrum halimedae]